MNRSLLILANLDDTNLLQTYRLYFRSPQFRGNILMCTALLGAITVSILFALVYARNKKKRHRYHHHHFHSTTEAAPNKPTRTWRPWLSKPRRRRKRRQSHRPMNPTLAQTGGLPPLREEFDTADPAP